MLTCILSQMIWTSRYSGTGRVNKVLLPRWTSRAGPLRQSRQDSKTTRAAGRLQPFRRASRSQPVYLTSKAVRPRLLALLAELVCGVMSPRRSCQPCHFALGRQLKRRRRQRLMERRICEPKASKRRPPRLQRMPPFILPRNSRLQPLASLHHQNNLLLNLPKPRARRRLWTPSRMSSTRRRILRLRRLGRPQSNPAQLRQVRRPPRRLPSPSRLPLLNRPSHPSNARLASLKVPRRTILASSTSPPLSFSRSRSRM